jgi:hypothetical protein
MKMDENCLLVHLDTIQVQRGRESKKRRKIDGRCLQGTDIGFTAGILLQKVLQCRTMRSQYRLSKQAHLMCPRTHFSGAFFTNIWRNLAYRHKYLAKPHLRYQNLQSYTARPG